VDALVALVLTGDDGERIEAQSRLVLRGAPAVMALTRTLPESTGEARQRLLATLEDLGALPEDVEVAERSDLLLWRLRGGSGDPAARTRALATLPGMDADVRADLEARARGDGDDRALALFALSCCDRAGAGRDGSDDGDQGRPR
jgi:hypothetical protein